MGQSMRKLSPLGCHCTRQLGVGGDKTVTGIFIWYSRNN